MVVGMFVIVCPCMFVCMDPRTFKAAVVTPYTDQGDIWMYF